MLIGRSAVITIADARKDSVWVWWVNTSMEADTAGARKVGAWELSRTSDTFADDLEALLFARMVVATSAGRQVVEEAGLADQRWVDLAATLSAVTAIRDQYQEVFDAEQSGRTKSKRMRDLQWPVLPAPIDIDKPPAARSQQSGASVGKALAIASWVDALVRAFEDIEAIRSDRTMLRDAFPPRDFPAVLV
jgi:hypothetical protein